MVLIPSTPILEEIMIDRQTLLEAKSGKTREGTLPDGNKYRIRKLTQAEVEHMRARYATDTKALEGLRYVVTCALVDEQGAQILQPADQDALAKVDFEVIQHIATDVIEFSGLKVPKS